MDHLDDYHTIRIICTDQSEESSTIFQDAFIDFSGNDNDESSCMKFNLSGLPSAYIICDGELVDGQVVDEKSLRKLMDKLLK